MWTWLVRRVLSPLTCGFCGAKGTRTPECCGVPAGDLQNHTRESPCGVLWRPAETLPGVDAVHVLTDTHTPCTLLDMSSGYNKLAWWAQQFNAGVVDKFAFYDATRGYSAARVAEAAGIDIEVVQDRRRYLNQLRKPASR